MRERPKKPAPSEGHIDEIAPRDSVTTHHELGVDRFGKEKIESTGYNKGGESIKSSANRTI
jgi:hypothetical protein